ncbi:hypothetical protein BCV70DRAFT_203016 [Testicularia cyperi]|uniref:Mid2 domain-containing protein n=1 Tax=Testicularia cyperi TaxID=1882483 RepID=A0A317XGL9_9BASI|nr:hypothetical protein BCV70DRAFT_203016 [Testicularia cyperi]
MVYARKLSTIAALSFVAASGAAASLQSPEASHATHLLAHRGLHEPVEKRGFIKVQKRLANAVGEGISGVISGIGQDLGLGDVAGHVPQPEARGIVGDLLGAGESSSSGSSSSAAQASSSSSGGGATSSRASASTSAAASSSTRASSTSGSSSNSNKGNDSNTSSNSNTSSSNSSNNNNNNSASSSKSSSTTSSNGSSNNSNSGSSSSNNVQAAASESSTSIDSAAAAASVSAAAASLISAAAASASATSPVATALVTETLADGSLSTSTASTTGTTRAGSTSSEDNGSSSTKIVVPIVVVAASLALAAVAWTLIRKAKRSRDEDYDPRMRPIDYEPSNDMGGAGAGLAAGGAAFAVGGASAGYMRDRRRGNSMESFEAGRPMSTLTEETGEYDHMEPPMQEVAPYTAAGGASFAPVTAGGRLHNYGGSQRGLPVRDAESNYEEPYDQTGNGYMSPYSDEHGGYDVNNYYDGSSNVGYNSRAVRGLDAAGAYAGASGYSPYEDLHRGDSVRSTSPEAYYAASQSARDPFR